MTVDAEPFVLPGFFVFLSINHTIIERNLRLQAVKRTFFLSLYEGLEICSPSMTNQRRKYCMTEIEYLEYVRACPYDAMGDFSVFKDRSAENDRKQAVKEIPEKRS